MTSRSFFLTHTFKNISKLDKGGSYYSDIEVRHDIPWKIRIFKKEGFLGVNLHCEKEECFEAKKWTFQTKFTIKLVAVGRKFFQRTVQHEFQKPEGHGMDKFISWENMLRDYVDKDCIIIEIHADIVSSTGFFEVKYVPIAQQDSDNSFLLKHTFKNISRLVERDSDYSDLEEHFNIPWRMEIMKLNEFLGIFLDCEKETCEGGKWTIECECEFKLISASGKSRSVQNQAVFGIVSGYGKREFISWNDLEKDYVTNDSIDVEVRGKIINITELPCVEKSFVLSHTVKSMSSIEEGRSIFSDIQNRFNIPLKLQIRRQDGFIGLFLHCSKQLDESRSWSIKTEYQFKLVSTNGRSVAFYGKDVFEKPVGRGWGKLIRWENWESRCNDTFVFEASVRILDTTGIEDGNDVDRFSGFAIPVGDQEYSMEKWLEMAFDH